VNSTLSFYATLPSSGRTIPGYITATVFLVQHDKIFFSVDGVLENQIDSVTSGESQVLSPQQNQNKVPIVLTDFLIFKVSKHHTWDCNYNYS
jgi:hypothetical protein